MFMFFFIFYFNLYNFIFIIINLILQFGYLILSDNLTNSAYTQPSRECDILLGLVFQLDYSSTGDCWYYFQLGLQL
jgi:hypothetical protein